MKFTIYTANCTGNTSNNDYPNRVDINSPESLRMQSKKIMRAQFIRITVEIMINTFLLVCL